MLPIRAFHESFVFRCTSIVFVLLVNIRNVQMNDMIVEIIFDNWEKLYWLFFRENRENLYLKIVILYAT